MAAAVMVQVFPAPTTCAAERGLPPLQDAPNGVLLVLCQVAITQAGAHHTGQCEVRAIELSAGRGCCEADVVPLREPVGALAVYPTPSFGKRSFIVAASQRRRRSHGWLTVFRPVRVVIVGGRRADRSGTAQPVRRGEPCRAVSRAVLTTYLAL